MESFEQKKRDPFIIKEACEVQLIREARVSKEPKFVEDRLQIKAKFDAEGAQQVSFARVRFLIENVWRGYSLGETLEGTQERVQYVFEDL